MKRACVLGLGLMGLLGAGALAQSAGMAGGPQRVVVDKSRQELRAYEGERLVMVSRVSTGRRGRETPSGRYHAGAKFVMHYSRLYDNAPMPYSVQVSNNYFIHGFSVVPDYPASHGCIRMPVENAREFFQWVRPGASIQITGQWSGDAGPQLRSRKPSWLARVFARRTPVPSAEPLVVAGSWQEPSWRRVRAERLLP